MCKKINRVQGQSVQSIPISQQSSGKAVSNAFIFISIVFTIAMSFLVVWPIMHHSTDPRTIDVCLSIPDDSLSVAQILRENESQIEQLVGELESQSQEISDKYNLLLKSQETESDFFRLVSCIAAFIAALLGFLGYRTIKDIEAKAQSIAEEKAGEIANKYVSEKLETEVERQFKDSVINSTSATLIKEQIINRFVPDYIKPIENRLEKLEEKHPPIRETDELYREEERAFDDVVGTNFDELNDKQDGGESYE